MDLHLLRQAKARDKSSTNKIIENLLC